MVDETPLNPPSQEPGDTAGPANPGPQPGNPAKRRLGRKDYHETRKDLKTLLASIRFMGTVSPGVLAEQLKVPRSTLAYNLNWLIRKGYIERLGGGRSIRYRLVPDPHEDEWRLL